MDDSSAVTGDEARKQMTAWLRAPEARAAATTELRRFGLDFYDADDLLQDVALTVLRSSLPEVIDKPIGYARRALRNRAQDLLRGERARPDIVHLRPIDDDDPDPLANRADPKTRDDPAAVTVDRAIEDEVRRLLAVALANPKVWVAAAALTTVTLRLHDAVAIPSDAPVPDGTASGQAESWAALWFAGQVTAFPDVEAGRLDGPALRKARSRRLNEVTAVLTDAVTTALAGAAPHG